MLNKYQQFAVQFSQDNDVESLNLCVSMASEANEAAGRKLYSWIVSGQDRGFSDSELADVVCRHFDGNVHSGNIGQVMRNVAAGFKALNS